MTKKSLNHSSLLPDTLQEAISTLRDIEQNYINAINRLETDNTALKDEHYKDKELKRLQEKINYLTENMHRGFPITEEEEEKINAWKDNHILEKHWKPKKYVTKQGPVDCTFSYQFFPTILDTTRIVKCSCGAEFSF